MKQISKELLKKGKVKANNKNDDDYLKLVKVYKDSPVGSEFQRLINKLDSLRNGKEKQVVLVTSALMGEGKSTITTQLAITAARNLIVPTLLVDTDIRHATLHKIFRIKPNFGLADCLDGHLPLEWCINEGVVPNLKILTSGTSKTNPLELITLEKMKSFLDEIRNQFDMVFLDSAPIIPVSDPVILGRLVDTVILVIKVGETSKQIVKRAIEMMNKSDIKIFGIILNNVNDLLPYYYNYKFYDYEYYPTDC